MNQGALGSRYRLLEKLGEGAMGAVYLVEHLQLGRREALKVLHGQLASDARFVARFRREARATNRVHHPNVVSVYDFGQLPDGRLYYSMEPARGSSVASLIERGPLPMAQALRILGELASAIDHAHGRGVIHRDLKPQNLVLTAHEQGEMLKVLDFGLAKIIANDELDKNATRQGEISGTPEYMAPEQFRGKGSDPRLDIYAVGCIGYAMLVGKPPFSGRPLQLYHAHMTQAPRPPGELSRAHIPPMLDELILRCLAKDPDHRYQSGREILVALAQLRPDDTRESAPLRDKTPRRHSGSDTFEDETDINPLADLGFRDTGNDLGSHLREIERVALLRQLTEILLDLGAGDPQLLVAAASVKDMQSELNATIDEAAAIEDTAARAERRYREREAQLRFSLGEVRFEADRAAREGKHPLAAAPWAIATLERRLAAVHAELSRTLEDLTDRSIAIATRRAAKEDQLDALCDALHRRAAAAARACASDALVAELCEKLGDPPPSDDNKIGKATGAVTAVRFPP